MLLVNSKAVLWLGKHDAVLPAIARLSCLIPTPV